MNGAEELLKNDIQDSQQAIKESELESDHAA